MYVFRLIAAYLWLSKQKKISQEWKHFLRPGWERKKEKKRRKHNFFPSSIFFSLASFSSSSSSSSFSSLFVSSSWRIRCSAMAPSALACSWYRLLRLLPHFRCCSCEDPTRGHIFWILSTSRKCNRFLLQDRVRFWALFILATIDNWCVWGNPMTEWIDFFLSMDWIFFFLP